MFSGFCRLGPQDASAMAGLEQACFSLPWSLAQCRQALIQKSFAAFGGWNNGVLIAYVSCYHILPEMEILNVAVLESERRKGIGRRLLGMVLQAGVKMGMQKATLEVRESNLPALRLYQSLGFEQCGQRRRYYPDTGENALVLALYF